MQNQQNPIILILRKRIRDTPCFNYFLFVDFNLGKSTLKKVVSEFKVDFSKIKVGFSNIKVDK